MTRKWFCWLALCFLFDLGILSADQETEVKPIRCWWQSSVTSVRVGEEFDVVLTCQVIESDNLRVALDGDKLGPEAASFAPYRILNKVNREDLIKNEHRFFQYHYILKIISEDYFGKEAPLPAFEIAYRLEKKLDKDPEFIKGKEQKYKLPALPIKIQSLVPQEANDIRDTKLWSFGLVKARTQKARLAFAAAAFVAAISAAIFLIPFFKALILLFSAKRPAKHIFSQRSVIKKLARELARIEKAKNEADWNQALLDRLLVVFRICGELTKLHPNVTQSYVEPELGMLGGFLNSRKFRFERNWIRVRQVVIYSSTTPQELGGSIKVYNFAQMGNFLNAFEKLNEIQYGPAQDADKAELDDILKVGRKVVGLLKIYYLWPIRLVLSFKANRSGRNELRGR